MYLVYLEPLKETSHVLFLHVGSKLTASGFFDCHVLVTISFELSVQGFPLALPSKVSG